MAECLLVCIGTTQTQTNPLKWCQTMTQVSFRRQSRSELQKLLPTWFSILEIYFIWKEKNVATELITKRRVQMEHVHSPIVLSTSIDTTKYIIQEDCERKKSAPYSTSSVLMFPHWAINILYTLFEQISPNLLSSPSNPSVVKSSSRNSFSCTCQYTENNKVKCHYW